MRRRRSMRWTPAGSAGYVRRPTSCGGSSVRHGGKIMADPIPDGKIVRCEGEHGCGAEIVFARSDVTGRIMPLDAKPVPIGTWKLTRDIFGVVVAFSMKCRSDKELRVSHFATCPNASAFRRREAADDASQS